MLAGHGPRALGLAATHADTWNTYGGPGSAELDGDDFWQLVGCQVTGFDEACEREGRDPASIRRSLLLGFGSEQPTARLASYLEAAERATALAIDELVVQAARWGEVEPRELAVHEQALAGLR